MTKEPKGNYPPKSILLDDMGRMKERGLKRMDRNRDGLVALDGVELQKGTKYQFIAQRQDVQGVLIGINGEQLKFSVTKDAKGHILPLNTLPNVPRRLSTMTLLIEDIKDFKKL
ncbi:MAG: hypothetical protein ABH835_00595 [Patescibacteria group bacterium]